MLKECLEIDSDNLQKSEEMPQTSPFGAFMQEVREKLDPIYTQDSEGLVPFSFIFSLFEGTFNSPDELASVQLYQKHSFFLRAFSSNGAVEFVQPDGKRNYADIINAQKALAILFMRKKLYDETREGIPNMQRVMIPATFVINSICMEDDPIAREFEGMAEQISQKIRKSRLKWGNSDMLQTSGEYLASTKLPNESVELFDELENLTIERLEEIRERGRKLMLQASSSSIDLMQSGLSWEALGVLDFIKHFDQGKLTTYQSGRDINIEDVVRISAHIVVVLKRKNRMFQERGIDRKASVVDEYQMRKGIVERVMLERLKTDDERLLS